MSQGWLRKSMGDEDYLLLLNKRVRLDHLQVEYMINEATSAENLCMMYEGWMSWV